MKLKKTENNILLSFALSLGVCIATVVAVTFILALIANSSANSTENIPLFTLVSLVVSAAASGVMISRIKGQGGIKFTALVALTFVLILLLIAIIATKGAVPPSAFMNYGCYLGTSLLSAYLTRSRGKARRRRR